MNVCTRIVAASALYVLAVGEGRAAAQQSTTYKSIHDRPLRVRLLAPVDDGQRNAAIREIGDSGDRSLLPLLDEVELDFEDQAFGPAFCLARIKLARPEQEGSQADIAYLWSALGAEPELRCPESFGVSQLEVRTWAIEELIALADEEQFRRLQVEVDGEAYRRLADDYIRSWKRMSGYVRRGTEGLLSGLTTETGYVAVWLQRQLIRRNAPGTVDALLELMGRLAREYDEIRRGDDRASKMHDYLRQWGGVYRAAKEVVIKLGAGGRIGPGTESLDLTGSCFSVR